MTEQTGENGNRMSSLEKAIIFSVIIYLTSNFLCIVTLLPNSQTEYDPNVIASMIEQGMVPTPSEDGDFGSFDVITPSGDH